VWADLLSSYQAPNNVIAIGQAALFWISPIAKTKDMADLPILFIQCWVLSQPYFFINHLDHPTEKGVSQ